MGPRNRFQGMKSASLCSLAGRYDNPIPPRFLAHIDSLKIPALLARPSAAFSPAHRGHRPDGRPCSASCPPQQKERGGQEAVFVQWWKLQRTGHPDSYCPQRPQARWPALIGVLSTSAEVKRRARGAICTVMEAAKDLPSRLLWHTENNIWFMYSQKNLANPLPPKHLQNKLQCSFRNVHILERSVVLDAAVQL